MQAVEREALLALVDTRGMLLARVTPNARSARMAIETESTDGPRLRIWVTVPPEDGKANKAVIAMLAKALDLPKSSNGVKRLASSRST